MTNYLRILIIFSCVPLLLAGANVPSKFDYEEYMQKMANYIFEYQVNNSLIHADSALLTMDQILTHYPDHIMVKIHKAHLLFQLEKLEGIDKIIASIDDEFFETIESKTIFYNKIDAKKSLKKGDKVSYNRFINNIIEEYEELLNDNRKLIDSMLVLPTLDEIYIIPKIPYYIKSYYKYKSILLGKEVVLAEIHDYEKRLVNANPDFFEHLRIAASQKEGVTFIF